MKIKILITTLVFALALGIYYHAVSAQNDPLEVISLIKKNINPKDGSIMDYAGDINYRGPESVGYAMVGDKKLRIFFGDLQFDLNQEELNDEAYRVQLKAIGITLRQNKKTGKLIVEYHGEEVAERSPER